MGIGLTARGAAPRESVAFEARPTGELDILPTLILRAFPSGAGRRRLLEARQQTDALGVL